MPLLRMPNIASAMNDFSRAFVLCRLEANTVITPPQIRFQHEKSGLCMIIMLRRVLSTQCTARMSMSPTIPYCQPASFLKGMVHTRCFAECPCSFVSSQCRRESADA
eukprot:scaffold29707_cov17-Prasinocladus_malaysianus.AAC.2